MSCVDEKDADGSAVPLLLYSGQGTHPTGLLAGGAFAPHKRFRPRRKPCAGRIHFAQALKYQKVEPPFGCPLVLGSVDKIDTMIKRKHKYGRSKLNLNRKVF